MGLLHRLSSNEDENRCWVCPHADHHEKLSFIMRVTYKYVLCCFVIFSSLVMYVEYFKKRTVGWKVVTGAYFKARSYFTRVSTFQLQSNFMMAESSAQKYEPLQSRHNNSVIEPQLHLRYCCIIVAPPL